MLSHVTYRRDLRDTSARLLRDPRREPRHVPAATGRDRGGFSTATVQNPPRIVHAGIIAGATATKQHAFVTMARPPAMDLLEYQGKQLFARHGVPVPSGAPATTVEEAVAAADEIGYPCVVKAQVQIGGRGKAGGIKVAKDRAGGRGALQDHPRDGHPRPHGPRGVDRGGVGHRGRVLRVDRLRPLRQAPAGDAVAPRAAWTSRRSPSNDPTAIARLHVDPLLGFQDFHARRLAFEAGVDADVVRPLGALLTKLYDAFVKEEAMLVEVNPLIVTPDRKVAALDAKVTLDDNSALPPPRQRRAAQRRRRGRAGADGARARPDVRQARRQRRHPRQRRRAS